MINLKEAEGIEYLKRVRATIGEGNNNFYNLSLLKLLTNLEILYLQNLLESNLPQPTVLTIGTSGLPDLESWLMDSEKMMARYHQLKLNRVRSFLPVVQELANLKVGTAIQASQGLAKVVEQDYPLQALLSTATTEQIELLSGAMRSFGKNEFPLLYHQQEKGGILSWLKYRYDTTQRVIPKTVVEYALYYKYVDFPLNDKHHRPYLLAFFLKNPDDLSVKNVTTAKYKISNIDGLISGQSITNLVRKVGEDVKGKRSVSYNTAKQLHTSLVESHPAFNEAYLKLDTTSLGSQSLDLFLLALGRLRCLYQELGDFSRWITSKEFNNNSQQILTLQTEWAERLQAAFDGLPSEQLKISAQLAWAEALKGPARTIEQFLEEEQKKHLSLEPVEVGSNRFKVWDPRSWIFN